MLLTQAQKDHLIDLVNEKVNLPILGEKAERKLIEKGIDKVLEILAKELPPEVLQLLNDASDGFVPGGEGDIQDAIDSTVDFLNKEINLPLMNEQKEEELFKIVVEALFKAMEKGNKIEG